MNLRRMASTAKNLPARWKKARSPKRREYAKLLKQIKKEGFTPDESARASKEYLGRAREREIEASHERMSARFFENYFKEVRSKPKQLFLPGMNMHPLNEAEAEKFVRLIDERAEGHEMRAKEQREKAVAHRIHSIKSKAPTMRDKINSTKAVKWMNYWNATKGPRNRIAQIDRELAQLRKNPSGANNSLVEELATERESWMRQMAGKRKLFLGTDKFVGLGAARKLARANLVKNYKSNLEILKSAGDGALVDLMVSSFDFYNAGTDAVSKRKAKEGVRIHHYFVLERDNPLSRKRAREFIAMAMSESGTKLSRSDLSKIN